MSKIFNVIKNLNLLDFGEAQEPEHCSSTEVLATGVDTIPLFSLRPAAAARRVRLRIADSLPIFPFDTKHQEAAEQYRIIRTKLLHHPKKLQLLVVSSATSGDGKTVTAINLAASLALKQNSHVLLVDADLRRPRVAEMLGIPTDPGLAEVLAGTVDLDSALVHTAEFPNLFVLPAGAARTGAAELLDSQHWPLFVSQIRDRFSTVLFDAPPIALVADYELIQLACDGAIFVIRPDHSHRASCFKALELVPRDKLIGVILNCFDNWWLWKSDTYSYYHSD